MMKPAQILASAFVFALCSFSPSPRLGLPWQKPLGIASPALEDGDKLLPNDELENVIFLDRFEQGLDAQWLGDRAYFTTSSNSLRPNGNYLSPLSLVRPSNRLSNTVWELGIQANGSFSNNNYVRVYLASNSANVKSAHQSYQLQLTGDDANLHYQLWRQDGNSRKMLFEGRQIKNDPSLFRARVRVACDLNGNWQLWLAESNGSVFSPMLNESNENKVVDPTPLYDTRYVGMQFHYTPARQQDIRIDYFMLRKLEEDPPPPEPIKAGEIIINELLSNPYSGGVEFVELFNRSDSMLDLGQLYLARKTNGRVEQLRPVSRGSLLLAPSGYKVLSSDGQKVRQYYHAPDAGTFHDMAMPQINNNEGHILLVRADSSIIDEFYYHSGLHSPFINNARGVSLERKSAEQASTDPNNWASASTAVGYATPGYANSQSSSNAEEAKTWLTSRTVSPDQDGFEDELELNYTFPQDGIMANVIIFNDKGVAVRRLLQAHNLGKEGSLHWDGLTDSAQKAKIGIYMMHIEAYHISGWRKIYKHSFVVAYKQ